MAVRARLPMDQRIANRATLIRAEPEPAYRNGYGGGNGTRPPTPEEELSHTGDGEAPWSPVPTQAARDFLNANPDAKIEVVFPTVYEEDRTAKLKDLVTAQAVMAITHKRMAEQIAKELGYEEYDYVEEQAQIRDEEKTLPSGELGVGDLIAQRVIGLGGKGAAGGGGGQINIGAPAPGLATSDGADATPHRAELSGTASRAFRRQQRQAEADRRYEALRSDVQALVRGLAELREAFGPGQHPRVPTLAETSGPPSGPAGADVEVVGPGTDLREALEGLTVEVRRLRAERAAPTTVSVQPSEAPPPLIEVVTPPARAMRRRVERDGDGLITGIVDEPIVTADAPGA